ncbi:MAG: CPBP family intramembrane metalloprotease [Planctomycetota bacterium]|jgi:membrane protease YdiL (CAAX protease family)|nr:CPBP family intramembrane metalloprotease [Planctomycetota bacterium]
MPAEPAVTAAPAAWLSWAAAVAIAAFLAAAASLLTRARRGQQLIESRPQRPVPWQGGDVILVALAYLQIALLAGAFLGSDPPTDQLLAANLLIVATATALATAWLVGRGATLADLGLSGGRLRQDAALASLGLALVLAPLLAMAAALNAWVPYEHPVVELLTGRRDPIAVGLVIATAVVAAPIGEELFFRRILQGWLEKVFADRRPGLEITMSAAAFALAHRGQGLAYLPLFPLGLVLGLIAGRTGSIVPCILLHAMFNAVSVALLLAEPAG